MHSRLHRRAAVQKGEREVRRGRCEVDLHFNGDLQQEEGICQCESRRSAGEVLRALSRRVLHGQVQRVQAACRSRLSSDRLGDQGRADRKLQICTKRLH